MTKKPANIMITGSTTNVIAETFSINFIDFLYKKIRI